MRSPKCWCRSRCRVGSWSSAITWLLQSEFLFCLLRFSLGSSTPISVVWLHLELWIWSYSPVLLFYGARDYKSPAFCDKFEALNGCMNLQVIYVIIKPWDGWQGEKGFINAEIMMRYLPKQYKRFVYCICSPDPLIDAVEVASPELGIPREKVLSERFGRV